MGVHGVRMLKSACRKDTGNYRLPFIQVEFTKVVHYCQAWGFDANAKRSHYMRNAHGAMKYRFSRRAHIMVDTQYVPRILLDLVL